MLEKVINSFQQLLTDFINIIPKIVGAIMILLIGFIIAKLVSSAIRKILSKIGIDKLGDQINEIEFIEKSSFKVVPSEVFSKIIYYILILIFAIISTEILEFKAVSDLVADILNYIPNIIASIIVLSIGLIIAEALRKIVTTTTQSLGIPSAKIIGSFVFYFILLMTVVTALSQMGIDTNFIRTNLTVILAGGVFAFALGYGLASKDTMANFLASFYSKDMFQLGDRIKIEDATGEIIAMDSNTLTLLGDKQQKIIIPLKKLTTEKVEIIEG